MVQPGREVFSLACLYFHVFGMTVSWADPVWSASCSPNPRDIDLVKHRPPRVTVPRGAGLFTAINNHPAWRSST
jgi:hypothetical protein